jgi:hypothetical protein
MINSLRISAYTQYTAKYNNAKSAQTDSFHKANESNVLKIFHSIRDTAEISQEAKNIYNNVLFEAEDDKTSESKDKMSEWKEKLEQMRRDMNWLRDEIRRAGEIAEGMGEAMREMIKCLRIAMRIMSGHNVPEADHRYLMDKDTALYSKAIMMRKEIIDPEDLERLSEDEEDNKDSSEIDELSKLSADISTESSGDGSSTETAVEIDVS